MSEERLNFLVEIMKTKAGGKQDVMYQVKIQGTDHDEQSISKTNPEILEKLCEEGDKLPVHQSKTK